MSINSPKNSSNKMHNCTSRGRFADVPCNYASYLMSFLVSLAYIMSSSYIQNMLEFFISSKKQSIFKCKSTRHILKPVEFSISGFIKTFLCSLQKYVSLNLLKSDHMIIPDIFFAQFSNSFSDANDSEFQNLFLL